MQTILTYLNEFLLNYIIISGVIWIAIIALKRNIKNKILLYFEILYVCTITILLFYPSNTLMDALSLEFNYFELTPFKTITEYISNGNYVMLAYNLFILMPIPIILSINKIPAKINIAVSFFIAVSVELIQLIINIITKYPNKIIDIDDFILYVVGISIGLVFTGIYKYCRKKFKQAF